MKITTKNAALALDFDLDGIVRWANEASKAADVRGPGHLAAIRKAAFEVRMFAKSLAESHASVIALVPGATTLAEENAEAEAVVDYVVNRR